MGMEINNQVGFKAVNFKANQNPVGATTLKPSFKANEEDSFVSSQKQEEGFFAKHWGKLLIGLAALATGAYFIFKGRGQKVAEDVTTAVEVATEKAQTVMGDVADKLGSSIGGANKIKGVKPRSLSGDSSEQHIRQIQSRTSKSLHDKKQQAYEGMDWQQPTTLREEVAAPRQ